MNRLVFFIAVMLVVTHVWGQTNVRGQKTVSGKVTDNSGEGLPGVNVVIKGTTIGSITDFDGNYQVSVEENSTLVFSFVGFAPQEIEVGTRSVINMTLSQDVRALDEVVVTALGIEREKKALGYSVTQVAGEDFTESRAINLGAALSGKVAGVNVTPTASGAAGSTRVIIRGGSSLSGNDQPLYIINGIPIDNTTLGSASLWGGSDAGDGLASLNPDDIASISVLKGNTAASLYGARASNGVILITTKSGKAGQGVGVSYNSNFTANQVHDFTDFQKEYGHGTNGNKPTNESSALTSGQSSWGAKLDGSDVVQFDGQTRPYSDQGQTIRDFYRTGNTWTNTLGLSGGNEAHTYRFSFSRLQNEDIVPNSGFDRNLASANISGKYGKLSLRASGQYSKETAENRPRLSDSPGNANFTALMLSPAITFESLKGNTNKLGAKADGTELQHQGNIYAQNPYWAAYQFRREDIKDRFLGSALVRYDITDWLYVQGRLGTDIVSTDEEDTEAYGTAYKGLGSFNTYTKKIREDNADAYIGFNKTFNDIGIDILLGGNRMRRSDERIKIGGNDLNVPFFHSVTNVNGDNQSYTYGFSEWGINSIFYQANFSYKNYLFLNTTGRQDQFSTLAKGKNSIFYPSVGLSFVFTDIFDINVLPVGKVRVSWAQVGGGAPNPYALNQTYSLDGASHNGAVLGKITQNSIPNESLQPFLSSEIEIGADLRFLDNKLGIDVAYYTRRTTDDILNTSISSTSGFSTTTINIGELTNEGIELLINATPIQKNGFTWDISLNMANNTSNVVSLGKNAEGEPIEFLNFEEARTRQERIRHHVGNPLGLITGYKHRIDEATGKKVYEQPLDEDKNPLDVLYPVRSKDFEILGEGRHPFSAGLRNTFSYKNFSMGILIDMRSGGSVMSGTNVSAYGFGTHKETLPGRDGGLLVSGMLLTKDKAGKELPLVPIELTIPVDLIDEYYNRYNNITEYFVYDASFGKLREFTLGYNFSKTFLKDTPFQSLNLSFVGRNLFLLWSNVPNIDPESGYTNGAGSQGLEFFALPTTRNFGFNLSVTF